MLFACGVAPADEPVCIDGVWGAGDLLKLKWHVVFAACCNQWIMDCLQAFRPEFVFHIFAPAHSLFWNAEVEQEWPPIHFNLDVIN
jgi:hypothetical protein